MTIAATLPSTSLPATVLAPTSDLFARRARRLRTLAANHPLAAWLDWLAALADSQQEALNAHSPLGLHFDGRLDREMPLLSLDDERLRQAWKTAYRQLSTTRGLSDDALDDEQLKRLARRCITRAAGLAVEAPLNATDVLVAAALQVAWSAGARELALPETLSLNQREHCPCCGSAPSASIVMAVDGKSGLRYLECSLCATRWNAVRARCTLCEHGSVVDYLGIEGGNEAVQAETCEYCHGYIKTFFQNKDIHVDPLADDLASLALDVLVGEQGFGRGAPNLFLLEGEGI